MVPLFLLVRFTFPIYGARASFFSENIIITEEVPLLHSPEYAIDLQEIQSENEKRLSLAEMPAEIIENILSRLNVIDYANFLNAGLNICRSGTKEMDLIVQSGQELHDLKQRNEEDNKKIWKIRKSIPVVLYHIVKMKKTIDKIPKRRRSRLRYYAGLMEQVVREIYSRSNNNSDYFLSLIFSLFVRQPLFLNVWTTSVTKEFRQLFAQHVLRAMAATGKLDYIEELLKECPSNMSNNDLLLEWAVEDGCSVNTLDRLVDLMGEDTVDRKNFTLTKCAQFGRLDLLEPIMKDSFLGIQKVWAVDLFITACEWGHQNIVMFLWSRFRREISNCPCRHEAVVRASRSGNIGLIKSLLSDKQFRQFPNDLFSQSVFDPTYQEGKAVVEAAKVGRLDIIKFLVSDFFLWVHLPAEIYVNKVIIAAASGGYLDVIKYFLAIREDGLALFPIENVNDEQDDAFIEAATNGHVHILEYFLNTDEMEGAVHPFLMNIDPAAKNSKAFRGAAQHGHLAVVQFLLSTNIDGSRHYHQIDPAAKDNDAVKKACRGGHLSIVKYLLEVLPHGLFKFPSVNPAANNNEPLIEAAKNGHVEIVKFLLQRDNEDIDPFYFFQGINVAAQNNRALIDACTSGHLDVVQELLRLDANGQFYYPGIDLTVGNNEPLIMAAFTLQIPIVRFLLAKRPDGTFHLPGIDPHARGNIIERIAIVSDDYFLIKTIFLCSYGSAGDVEKYLDNPLIASIENEPSTIQMLGELALEWDLKDLLNWLIDVDLSLCTNVKICLRVSPQFLPAYITVAFFVVLIASAFFVLAMFITSVA